MKWWLLCWVVLPLESHGIKNCKELGSNPDLGYENNQGLGRHQNQVSHNGISQDSGHERIGKSNPDQDSDELKSDDSAEDKKEWSCQNKNPGSHEKKKPGKKGRKGPVRCQKKQKSGVRNARLCMEDVTIVFKNGNRCDAIEAIESLEQFLEETEVTETMSMNVNSLVTILHKSKGPFKGLEIYASENEAITDKTVPNRKVSVRLPRELDAGSDNTIVFCMLTLPESNETSDVLYERRLVGLSVRGKNISGLKEDVSITINLTADINETQQPRCVFLNFSTHEYSNDGCQTLWKPGQSYITCSCDHLTYFGVLLVTASLSATDLEIQSYVTLVGCSLSLVALAITVLLFITNRKLREDVSMKIHIHLAIALILLNLHFLTSQTVAALSSTELCLYMALSLHYSLLATFSWMALEGFHIYLLLVRVFNIYIKRYMLKLSMAGWGIPAVIVSLVVIIDSQSYGRVPVDNINPNSTTICYIVDETVKMVTTVGVFCLVFIFNVTMFGVTVRHVVNLQQRKEVGQSERIRAKRAICTLLGVTTLLGITWGLVFFSFGYLSTAGLYVFTILNSLQGVFIFLWFVMSMRKTRISPTKPSSDTRSTNN